MKDSTPSSGPALARHFRRLYLVALSLIAALAIGGQLLIQHSLRDQLDAGHIVNKAGYQRMLSQRISLKTMLHESGPAGEIHALCDRWLSAHAELAGQAGRIAHDERARESLTGLLDEAARPMRRIARLAAGLGQRGPLTPPERAALMADQEMFLPRMDAVVLGLEHSVHARVTFLRRIELALLLLTLVVLTLEAWLIFRPAVRHLQDSLDQLELRNRQSARRLASLRHLTGGIAHSFNNLLTAILGHADLQRIDAIQHHRSTEYIDAQISASRRAAQIVDQLVRYSGGGRYDCEPVALGNWLRETVPACAFGGASVKLVIEVVEDAVARVDHAALRQALDGILANAVEAMDGAAGAVTIRLAQAVLSRPRLMSGPYRAELPAGLYACIRVTDHGQGIPEESLDRIFDPYFTSRQFGRGLGLASVLGIAHGHGGGITIESVPGRGSAVSLYLPLDSASPATHTPRPDRARVGHD